MHRNLVTVNFQDGLEFSGTSVSGVLFIGLETYPRVLSEDLSESYTKSPFPRSESSHRGGTVSGPRKSLGKSLTVSLTLFRR